MAKQAGQSLYAEIGQLQDYHVRDAKLWQEIKLEYEARAHYENPPPQNGPGRTQGKDRNRRRAYPNLAPFA